VAWFLRLIAFPLGRWRRPPSDRLAHACAGLILSATETRERLTDGIYISRAVSDPTGRIESAFAAAIQRDATEEKIRAAGVKGRKAMSDLVQLVQAKIITQTEADALARANMVIRDAIDVDDFEPSELTGRETSTMRSAAAAE
jgi:acyl-CoA dehydrogenase